MASKVFKLLLPFIFFNGTSLSAQLLSDSNWYWASGDYLTNQRGIYSFVSYWPYYPTPGSRSDCAYWTDNSGKFWLFGGAGYDATGQAGDLNDLWRYVRPFEWTWVKGDNTINQPDVYGTEGVSNISNKPGGRCGSVTWTDNDGNLWLFGGRRNFNSGGQGISYLNDLWKYNIIANEWTWVSGESATNQHGVYGTIGVADAANHPGARESAVGWKDLQGNLWLFGGSGLGIEVEGWYPLLLNDLWKYNIITGQWTWVKGDNQQGYAPGVYGTRGVDSIANNPGARRGSAAWVDNEGNLWLWGGNGVSETPGGLLNDLWKYNVSTGNWTWMNGAKRHDQATSYGTKGVAGETNTPGGREKVFHWKDAYGNFWLYGGMGPSPSNPYTCFNDLWKYQLSTNQWTWIKGDTIPGIVPLFDVRGTGIVGRPGARAAGASWSEANGRLWLFGGEIYRPISGNNQFNDLWFISSSSFILPVTLVYFFASIQNDNVNLEWKTENEIGFSHFNVQRSTNGISFQTIGTVRSNNQTGSDNYSYPDINACSFFAGRLFYRLQMIDKDGTTSFSNIESIDLSQSGLKFMIVSNPVKDELKLMIDQLQNGNVVVRITNMAGSNVQYTQLKLEKGRNVVRINISSLAKGTYVLSAQSAEQTNNLKFIKQ